METNIEVTNWKANLSIGMIGTITENYGICYEMMMDDGNLHAIGYDEIDLLLGQ